MSTVMIKIGSGGVQAGLAGDTAPRVQFPTLVNGQSPLTSGVIQNWDAWTSLVKRAFTELGVASQGASVLFSEAPLTPKATREKMTQLAFGTLGVDSMYVSIDAALSLYATNRSNGIVFISEGDVAHAVPIYEGYALPHAIIRLDLSTQHLDTYMQTILAQRGDSVDLDTARKLKEQLGHVALDFDEEMQNATSGGLNASATINGKAYTLGNERIRCTEALFQPAFVDMQSAGYHETTYNAILKCDVDVRKDMYSNIVLSGEATTLSGMAERMKKELIALAPPTMKIIITAPSNRDQLTFLGGAKLAAMDGFPQMHVTKAEYAESGPSIVHRKCF